ncbi:nucleolar protein 16 [Cataglyphis hispanica]|uniref:nucleolar protein 16 n=1 Tax=Cataglyphis hispanica TaxID=1086592 RepID=UPI00217F4AE5|nr:nucleolar protein 16 [Cataglyphis hispanica]
MIKKIKKLRRKKKYNPNVNRKRLRNKLRKLPNISCDPIKKAWTNSKSMRVNLREMGLAYDANEALQIPNIKHEMLEKAKRIVRDDDESLSDHEAEDVTPIKKHVMENLEAEMKAPRERRFSLPKGEAQFLTYLIKKYGEDYEAMSRDKKNHYQLTWKQIRAKIKMFKGIPEQYNKYVQKDSTKANS